MGCNIVALPSGSITAKTIQDALNVHRKVKLPAGELITINEPIYIPAGRKLYSDPANPATIRRTPLTRQRMIVFNGRDSKVAHLILDWNFAFGWEPYVIGIAFSAEEFASIRPEDKSGCSVINVKFVDVNGVVVHPIASTGDSWCVSFATDYFDEVQTDIRVIGCNCEAEFHQLTANGNSIGQRNLTVSHNKATGCFGTAIAFSSRASGTEFDGITVQHNFILETKAFGVFVGQDTQEVIAIKLDLTDILIDQNYVSHSSFRNFITSFVIRPGLDGGVVDNCVISNNISDPTKSLALEPRSVSYFATNTTPGANELVFTGNKSIGFARSALVNAEVTQSGNTYFGTSTPWNLSDLSQPAEII